jgi:hypothetical protein
MYLLPRQTSLHPHTLQQKMHSNSMCSFHNSKLLYGVIAMIQSHFGTPLVMSGKRTIMDNPSFASTMLHQLMSDLTHLYCTDNGCNTAHKCHCVSSGLPCTEFCSCSGKDCTNSKELLIISDSEEGDYNRIRNI